MQKRLQVFISSTYEDMRVEREVAIKSILQAKHVPAGMELFVAGSESQWEVIKQWIDACDVFMLILGGRYGSIEPTSGKSYIELEYDYAEQQGKPLFALVMSKPSIEKKVQEKGSSVIETANGPKLDAFRTRVLSKMAGRCDDTKDISLETFKALMEIVQRDDVHGWVPGGAYRKLLIDLEAAKQAGQVSDGQGEQTPQKKRASFEALVKTLRGTKVAEEFGGNLLEVLRTRRAELMTGVAAGSGALFSEICPLLEIFGYVFKRRAGSHFAYTLNDTGRQVVAALMAQDAGVPLEGD